MKKLFVTLLSLSLVITIFIPFLHNTNKQVSAEENNTSIKTETLPAQELFTDEEALKSVNEGLVNKVTFEIGSEVIVSKEEPGVEIGVTEIGDLQINVSNEEVLNDLIENGAIEPVEGENVLGYTVVIKEDQIDAYLDQEVAPIVIKPMWGNGLYVKSKGTSYGNGEIIRMSTYKGKSKATMTISESRDVEVSGTAGLPIKTIATELGITYKKSYTISDSYEINVPSGKTYRITAKDYLKIYSFEV
ncbi:hypothetical protein AB1282_19570 [Gottfriedia sp. S16(2024)]|uniref:hypothetical protein n=2 Tax=Bacillaceae TaxID=186817 RepID=UPI003D246946